MYWSNFVKKRRLIVTQKIKSFKSFLPQFPSPLPWVWFAKGFFLLKVLFYLIVFLQKAFERWRQIRQVSMFRWGLDVESTKRFKEILTHCSLQWRRVSFPLSGACSKGGLSDCWVFLCIIVRSLPYNIKHPEVAEVVICYYINKSELKGKWIKWFYKLPTASFSLVFGKSITV